MKHKIKGDIISWNSSIWDFNQKMRSVKEDEDITLEINSYGGDVFLGIDMMNTLRSHQGKVTVIITGIAASAASVIAMGADILKMYSNTQLMIHNAWTVARGNAKDLRKVADDLESIGESVLASYTHKVDADTVKKLLEEETYMSAKKAKEYGFIDEIVDDVAAEEVESEIFSNKAKEFNNTIKAEDKQLEKKIISLEDEITKLKQKLNEKEKEPKQPAAAQRRGFFF
ncbi:MULTISPECIES: head maturation protease, ClpP-related [unclassified Oceanobacillus]|uniref:head maturation protease, ClpP-related n=1 Tax=unclassified Oceanobacillus TaxID=2630292 RepID=UPI00300DF8F9